MSVLEGISLTSEDPLDTSTTRVESLGRLVDRGPKWCHGFFVLPVILGIGCINFNFVIGMK